MATYVDLVNLVLTRLRENNVTTVTDTSYSTLVAGFVNDAKREVEDAWQWGSLIDWVDIPVTTGVSVYSMNAYNGAISGLPMAERARPRRDLKSGKFMVFNTTANYEGRLQQAQYEAMFGLNAQNINWNVVDQPTQFAFTPLTRSTWASGLFNKNVTFYPLPNGNYTIRVAFTNPSKDLSVSTDVLYVPKEPVYQRALMYCLYERGEELGETLTLTQEKYKNALADAIVHDSSLQGNDMGFDVADANNPPGPFSGTW